ncbi:S41 family peptidase [Loigolactobacillus bifermentans]|uniref:S41 family peptidase n=1 Tax=Loigolactobacillus bifermentans TaxID=1607 RepID=UPI003B8334AC
MLKNKQTPKRKVSLLVYICSIILALALGIFGTLIGVTIWQSQQINTANTPASFQKLTNVYQSIQQNYYRKVSSEKLVNGAIHGMLNSLDDPYSEYLTGNDAGDLNNTISGNFEGIGAQVQKSAGRIEIIAPIAGSPAKKAGLKANDIIMSINGHSTAGLSVDQAVSKIRGKKGTSVKLVIKRGSDTFTVNLKRDVIPVTTVNTKYIKANKIGYIQVTTFSERTSKEFKAAVKKLRKQGAKSFIVDVRENPGGLMDQALKMSSMFLKNGQTIMQVKARTGAAKVYKAGKDYDKGFKITEPTKVLIDDGSASAAEIFSAALNQSAKIQLIGSQSFGKGTVQNVSDFNDNSEFKITVAKWLTPDGTWINKKGLTPNVKVKYPSYAYLPVVSTTKTYQQGDVAKNIKTMQQALKGLGYTVDTTNGYFSAVTQQAVRKFQTAQHLTVSGKLDKATMQKIQTELATKISQNDPVYDKAVDALK